MAFGAAFTEAVKTGCCSGGAFVSFTSEVANCSCRIVAFDCHSCLEAEAFEREAGFELKENWTAQSSLSWACCLASS